MEITLKFRDSDARVVTYYLKRRYAAKSDDLKKLAMVAIRAEVAKSAQDELDANAVPPVAKVTAPASAESKQEAKN